MPIIHTITTDVQLVAHFRALDERGDAVQSTPSQGTLSALTPLAAMEMFEQLHAARNQVRREAGLAEIGTPDAAVLVLAFLRLLRDEPAGSFGEVLRRMDKAVRQMQMNRVEEVTEPENPHGRPREWRCPACLAANDIPQWKNGSETATAEATCGACGETNSYQEWLWRTQRTSANANGQEPAEVTG